MTEKREPLIGLPPPDPERRTLFDEYVARCPDISSLGVNYGRFCEVWESGRWDEYCDRYLKGRWKTSFQSEEQG